ncbi:hypothetical protein SZ25_00545 [Candidatus Arcanobacter lacustris]|jgi:cell pole-organizing protein PopZ|uniref:DUF2497 domain-containing protein n=1 Tax=Candidatus Arcanibacter lacustris TaxID=1607817 RepID=A0A0F5MNN7_9RICK|nr:hypothetical protein SZ25_00545 [Candidatus Arcanobacter lacustris]
MDNKEDNSNTTTQDPSMEQILQTIRGVITEEEETPLELTEELIEDPSASMINDFDVLNTIDNAVPSKAADDGFGFSVADIVPKKENAAPAEAPAITVAPAPIVDDFDKVVVASPSTSNVTSPKKPEPENDLFAQSPVSENVSSSDKSKPDLLISERSAEDTSNTIKSFMKSVSRPASDGLGYKNNTVEELIIQMIKPYLKDWLDKNLPTIVKQIVEKEIHKLIPKEDD